MPLTQQFSSRLTHEQREYIDARAAAEGRRAADVVRALIDEARGRDARAECAQDMAMSLDAHGSRPDLDVQP